MPGTVSRDIRLSVTAEVEQYAKEMGKIPGITQKEAARAATALGKELAKAETVALKSASANATAANKSFGDLTRGAQALNPALGGAMRAAGDLAAAFGPAGAAVGVTAAALGLVVALGKLTLAAKENAAELEKQGLLTAKQADLIDESSAAVTGLGATWRELGAVIASRVAPFVDQLYTGLSGVLVVLGDLAAGQGIPGMSRLADEVERAKRAAEGLDEKLVDVKSSWTVEDPDPFWADRVWLAERIAQAEAEAAKAAEAAGVAESQWTAQLISDREWLLGLITDENEATVELAAQERQRFLDNMEFIRAEGVARVQAAQEWGAAENAAIQEARVAAAEANRERRADSDATTQAAIAGYLNLAGAALGALQGLVNEGSHAAKVLASLQIVVATLAGIQQQFASAPFPVAAGLAAIIAGIGAANIAAVWAAKPGTKAAPRAPSMGGGAGGGRPSRSQGTQHSGGDGRGTTPAAILQFRHRFFDEVTNDALRRGNSPLREAIAGAASPHRSR